MQGKFKIQHNMLVPNFTLPFRVGRKQMRAVLDAKGMEVVLFPRGLESYAKEYVEYVNSLKLGDTVYHEAIYKGKEAMKVVGLRLNTIELEGDYSGGTHCVRQTAWMSRSGVLLDKSEEEKLEEITRVAEKQSLKVVFDNRSPQCPYCKKSTMKQHKGSSTTLLYYVPTYNPKGVNVNPDKNKRTELLQCMECNNHFAIIGNEHEGFIYQLS